MRKLVATALLLFQGLGGSGVVLAHATERPGAPVAVDTQQHDGRCVVVHAAQRCAVCHATLALPSPGTARMAAAAAPAPDGGPLDRDAPLPSATRNPAAPPRAPPPSLA